MPQANIDPLASQQNTTKYGNSIVYTAATGDGTPESPYIPIVQIEGGGGGGGSATEITLSALIDTPRSKDTGILKISQS